MDKKRILRLVDENFNEELDAATESFKCTEVCNEEIAERAGYDAAMEKINEIMKYNSDVVTWKGLAILATARPTVPEIFEHFEESYIKGHQKAVRDDVLRMM